MYIEKVLDLWQKQKCCTYNFVQYISIYFCLWRSYLRGALILNVAVSFITSGGCQYVKGTKQIFIEVCVVEFGGLNSNFLVFKLHFYTFYCFTVLFYNVYTVYVYCIYVNECCSAEPNQHNRNSTCFVQ